MIMPPEGQPADGRQWGKGRATILVVDDDARNRALIGAHLADVYDVHEAPDAARALALLEREPVDLVLLDVMMPEMNGFDACRHIKQAFAVPYLPVILLTALDQQQDRNLGLESGADDFLSKPVDGHELLLRVRTFLRLRRQDVRIRDQLRTLTERDEVIHRQLEELDRLATISRHWAEELERANQDLESFSYSVSHDLRAPLRAIVGFSEALLTDQSGLDETGRNYLLRLRAATRRMSDLIDDLLRLARVSRAPIERQPVNLTAIARDVFTDLCRREPGRHVHLDVEEGLTVAADPRLLTIALENLLGNAWKFTSRRPAASLGIGRVLLEGETAFYVRDDGAGFDPTRTGKLFQPFQRLHSTSEFEGTGIGLATVKRIVARHGGRIWAESEIDRGATFFFTLQ
jgi:two-component system, NtrC family, sensor kinase